MTPEGMNEEMALMEEQSQREAPILYERYRQQMDLLEKSILAKVRPITSFDVYALGKQLHTWEKYVKWCEAVGSLTNLGRIPLVALDVIAVAYGTSIVPVIASVQPIAGRQGIVWFKNTRFGTTKGGHTANDVMLDPRSPQVTPRSYASNFIDSEVAVASTTSPTTNYTGTLSAPPILPESVRMRASNLTVEAKDDGSGNILGVGISGTINYATGAFDIDFAADPGEGETVVFDYQQDYERATNLPVIEQFWDSTDVRARVWALRGTFGLLQDFEMANLMGMSAEDELARDLVGSINAEIGGALIQLISANTQGTAVDFDRTALSGVGVNEHYQSFKVRLNQAEANLVKNAGRGKINCLIADVDSCAVLESVVGFQKLTDGNTFGAHVFGTLDGRTIIRVNDLNILGANTIRCIWKGPSPWEGPAVWSPYMPLVVTDTLQNLDNPLQHQRAAAVYGAVKTLVPNFITTMTISSS